MFEYSDKVCVICRADLASACSNSEFVTLTHKGLSTLLQCSEMHKDDELRSFLLGQPTVVNVHIDGRKRYAHKRRLEQHLQNSKCV